MGFFLMTFMGLFMMLPGDFQAMAFEELFTVASIVVHYITNHVLFGTLDLMGTGVGEEDVDGGMMEFLELLCICVILGLAYLGLSLAGCSCNGVRAAVARCCKGCRGCSSATSVPLPHPRAVCATPPGRSRP